MNNYIKNYLEQFNLYARKRQINIIFETNFESQEVWLDRNKMDSIIRNLMTNALKYTCQGGNVTVQTQKIKVIGSSLLQIQESESLPMNKRKCSKASSEEIMPSICKSQEAASVCCLPTN